MGARFELQHANWMLYLTLPGTKAPRATAAELRDFLGRLIGDRESAIPFLSSDITWPARMRDVAMVAAQDLPSESESYLESNEIERRLAGLRHELGKYKRFAFLIGNRAEDDEVTSFAKYLAYETRASALILIPYPLDSEYRLTVIDPYEPLASSLDQRSRWPGFLIWDATGASTFISFEGGNERIKLVLGVGYNEPSTLVESTSLFRRAVNVLRRDALKAPPAPNSIQLLHLSDLHFGRDSASRYEAFVLSALHDEIRRTSRVIISGDLFDQPRQSDYALFRNFRAALQRVSGRDPVVVPGNHDQKWYGNAPDRLRQVAELEWSTLVEDHDSRCIFFCFDSSRDGSLAAGLVTNDQLVDLGARYETLAVSRPQVRDYLRIAVVHHHPFSFETQRETLVQRFLSKVGLTDERFLRMHEADRFVRWLTRRNIPVVLHGHKHVQRHFEYEGRSTEGPEGGRRLTSIGCGTSLGAEEFPLTYNLLSWDHSSQSWSVSFFADPGDGSGFVRQRIAVHNIGKAA